MKPRLALKHSTGWFAAGREMEQALAILSDGAFKLYAYLKAPSNGGTFWKSATTVISDARPF